MPFGTLRIAKPLPAIKIIYSSIIPNRFKCMNFLVHRRMDSYLWIDLYALFFEGTWTFILKIEPNGEVTYLVCRQTIWKKSARSSAIVQSVVSDGQKLGSPWTEKTAGNNMFHE